MNYLMIANLTFAVINTLTAISNYRAKSYKTAMMCSFSVGLSLMGAGMCE